MEKSRFEGIIGQVVARKYTVMMNNEPIDLWIKGDQVQKANFLGRKVDLNLTAETIAQIKSHPTRLVNGNTLVSNANFTKETSKMLSANLHLAIEKRDLKILSRFARSNLVPDADKSAFIEAINAPRGIRKVLNAAVVKTRTIVANMAQNIENYFDRMQTKLVNNKLDEHLLKFQTPEMNKAPLLKDLDLKQNLDPKLRNFTRDFYNENKTQLQEQVKNERNGEIWVTPQMQDKFFRAAATQGFSVAVAKAALAKEMQEQEIFASYEPAQNRVEELQTLLKEQQMQIAKLKNDLSVAKNETLAEFLANSEKYDLSKEEQIDLLVENTEYKALPNEKQEEFENKHIFNQEHVAVRAVEVAEVAKIVKDLDNTPSIAQERVASIDFKSPETKKEIETLSTLAKQSKNEEAQTNIAAVKYNGISEPRLQKWKEIAVENKQVSESFADKLIENQLAQALKLANAGVLKEESKGVYKFKDNFAKETLMKNYDKSIIQIEQANKGKSVELPSQSQEIFDRVKAISSEASFAKMLDKDGKLDVEAVREYAKTLEAVSIQLTEKANRVEITREDLKQASQSQTQTQERGRERA
jgi:hypothetical protein